MLHLMSILKDVNISIVLLSINGDICSSALEKNKLLKILVNYHNTL